MTFNYNWKYCFDSRPSHCITMFFFRFRQSLWALNPLGCRKKLSTPTACNKQKCRNRSYLYLLSLSALLAAFSYIFLIGNLQSNCKPFSNDIALACNLYFVEWRCIEPFYEVIELLWNIHGPFAYSSPDLFSGMPSALLFHCGNN